MNRSPKWQCMFKLTLRGTLIFASCLIANMTSANTSHHAKVWVDTELQGKVTSTLLYSAQIQGHFNLEKNQFERGAFVGGFGYQPISSMSFWLGYQWNSPNQISHTPHENRIWEQMILDSVISEDVRFSSRTRLEQRKRDEQSAWAHRLREKITVKFPKHDLTPVAYDEIFINLNNPSWVQNCLINQNRFFVGLDWPLSKKAYLEGGYLNQMVFSDHDDNKMNHIVSVSLTITA